jgi:hypothetical protein
MKDHCDVAKQAIRDVFLTWGTAWNKLDVETRKAYLMLEIVQIFAGKTHPSGSDWDEFRTKVWTSQDCMNALEACENWGSKNLSDKLIFMAERDKDGFIDELEHRFF